MEINLSKLNFLTKLLKPKIQYIGLDIGTQSVKMVHLVAGEAEQYPPALNYGMTALPPGVFSDGVIHKPEAVVNSLKRLVEEAGLPEKATVTLGISGKQVLTRQLKLPQMPLKELEQAVRFEAEKYITIPLNQLFMDFTVMEEINLEEAPGYSILVAAAPQKMVYNLCQVMQKAGLSPLAVDVEPLALYRLWRASYYDEQLTNQALINLGHSNSHLVIFKGDSVQFSRVIPLAGNQLTEAIIQVIGKEVAAAEEKKRSQKIVHLNDYRSEPDDTHQAEGNLNQAITEVVTGLASEIQRSIDFYQMQAKVRLDRLIITGGTANLQGLDTYLETEIGLPVLVGGYGELNPVYSLASGLALREFMKI
jgi:type IV pilus assembly protein PilM